MAGLDTTSFAAALKELYTPDKLQELVLKKRPMMALCKKNEAFVGEWAKQPTLYANPQNASATFATASAETSTSSLSAFLVTRAKYFGFATVDNEVLKASAGDEGAFASAVETEVSGMINQVANSIAQQMYRSGWGTLGQIGSITSTTITLTDATSAFNFEKGMKIVFAATESASALGSATSVTVVSVNRAAGQIVIDGTTGSPANTNYIFKDGDRQNSATPSRLCLSGLSAWIPRVAPVAGSDSFFGVDRSVDSRLYGNSYDGSSVPIEEAFLDGIRISAQNGGSPDYIFTNPVQFTALTKSLGSKVQYIDMSVGKVGFRGIEIQGETGPVTVMQDIWAPGDTAFVVESDNLLLHSLGACPQIFDTDGLTELRVSTADAVQTRIYSYAQLRVLEPSHFVNIKLASA